MRIVEAQGYTKEEALVASGLDVSFGKIKNATQMWRKQNSPIKEKELRKFMENYTKDNKVMGAYLVVESSAKDTRVRPYSIINEVTTGKRKTKTTYQVKEGTFKVKYDVSVDDEGNEVKHPVVEVISLGAVQEKADKKDLAIKKMKALIEENKKDYVVEIVKEVKEGQPYAAYGQYSPSKSAKKGKFIFFVED